MGAGAHGASKDGLVNWALMGGHRVKRMVSYATSSMCPDWWHGDSYLRMREKKVSGNVIRQLGDGKINKNDNIVRLTKVGNEVGYESLVPHFPRSAKKAYLSKTQHSPSTQTSSGAANLHLWSCLIHGWQPCNSSSVIKQ